MGEQEEAFNEWASQPFFPDHLRANGNGVEAGERIAYALEYIAAQIGEMSRKMDLIGSGYTATREDFEAISELLKKL